MSILSFNEFLDKKPIETHALERFRFRLPLPRYSLLSPLYRIKCINYARD
jgi:hypothetical protein